MHTRKNNFEFFFLALLFCVLLLLFSNFSLFINLRSMLEYPLLKLQESVIRVENQQDKYLLENKTLLAKLSQLELLKEDNQALRDQFAKSQAESRNLLPAKVISQKDRPILDKGSLDGIKPVQAVIVGDNLVGEIVSTTPHFSVMKLISDSGFSASGRVVSKDTIGVIKGGNEGITMQNILLSQNIEKNNFIVTKAGEGEKSLPPDLVIGKVISVDKKDSALYQSAKLESLLDFANLHVVFVVIK